MRGKATAMGNAAARGLLGPNESAQHRPRPVRVRVGDLMIQVVRHDDLVRAMRDDVFNARRCERPPLPKLVFSANGQAVSMYHRNANFRALIDQADVIHADGMSAGS
jgi:N-acetylglucosaminyldiphosphoundecaprenol N-acetyl-beta-D-mannosaminyltransferase